MTVINLKKISDKLGIDGKSPAGYQKKKKFRHLDNCKMSAVNHSKETPVLLNFVNLLTMFSPGMQEFSRLCLNLIIKNVSTNRLI